MKYFYLIFLVFILMPLGLRAQTAQELEKELSEATDSDTRAILNYQLGEAYYARAGSENLKKAYDFTRNSHDLANRDKKYGLAADAAYLLGQISLKRRDRRNAEVWFKSCLGLAKLADDPDLIIRSVDQRSRLAERDRNYKRAYEINQEAFAYFSERGKSVSELERRFEIQKAQLAREKRSLERDKELLEREIAGLRNERNSLETEKDRLTRRQEQLVEEKEKVEEEISVKEEILDSVSQVKEIAERTAREKEREVKDLTREALEQKALEESLRADLNAQKLVAVTNRNIRNILILVSAFIIALAFLFYLRYRAKKRMTEELSDKNQIIEKERKRSDDLLLNILPVDIATELKEKGAVTARKYENVSVLFTDFKDFSKLAERLSPEQLVKELDYLFREFDKIISNYKIEKIKTIGDAYMCAGGLAKRRTLPLEVVDAALEMQKFMVSYKQERMRRALPYFEVRIGIHTGPVVAGVVGSKKFAYDIWGSTVNVAARMEESCQPGKVNISGATFGQIKYKFKCIPRGRVEAKNIGFIEMYYVLEKI